MPDELARHLRRASPTRSTIEYLLDLGVTAVELLPIHQFVTEQRLIKQGSSTTGATTPSTSSPCTRPTRAAAAQFGGTGAVLREFKGMVKLPARGGLEVILDVVYNHTAEEGIGGPTPSLRGLDNASYYRQTADGAVRRRHRMRQHDRHLGAGACAARSCMDSLRYWADERAGRRVPLRPRRRRSDGCGTHEFQTPTIRCCCAILDDLRSCRASS